MAGRKPKEAASVYATMPDPVDMMNAIRAESSAEYQNRIPKATQDNLQQIGNLLFTFDNLRREWLNGLIGRIGRTTITNRLYRNPLAQFKSMLMELGESEEEIFVDLIQGQTYDPARAEQNLFKRRLPNVHVMFHTMNSQREYPFTINDTRLRTAFLSYEGIDTLIGKIVDAAYSSDNYDEYLIMKEMLAVAGRNGSFGTILTPAVSKANSEDILIALREASLSLTLMSTQYNTAGVHTYSDLSSQVLITTPAAEATLSVSALAYAFNLEQADYLAMRVMVDSIPIDNCIAVLVDREWFRVYDNLIKFTEVYNASGLYWNYFLHHWSTFSYSPFANAIAFVTQEGTITALTISPATVTAYPGDFVDFTPTITSTGTVNKGIDWTVTGALSAETGITFMGQLYIGADEQAASLTVKATSRVDSTITATATVTITQTANSTSTTSVNGTTITTPTKPTVEIGE